MKMTDKKFTDEEIIKALECCKDCCCKQCDEEPDFQEAIDLINRQKAEIEQLKRNYDALKYQENLSNRHCRNICEPKYKAEIERLKENLNIELEKYATEYDNTIKAEAYKEFADMIKKNIKEVWNYDNGTCSCVLVLTKDIDNLLKEMVGNKLNFQK